MKKIVVFLKENTKVVIGIIIGLLVSGIIVYATAGYDYESGDVYFDNTINLTKNGQSVTTVQDALDALYKKASDAASGCPGDAAKIVEGSTRYVCDSSGTLPFINNKYIDGATSDLVAINQDGSICTSSCTIDKVREYRYSGAETTVNNWITFAGENWRIIGLFKGETDEGAVWNIKIMREESLGLPSSASYSSMLSGSKIISNSTTVGNSVGTGSHSTVQTEYTAGKYYWNYGGTKGGYADWNNAGIQAYLNDDQSESWYYDNFVNSSGKGYPYRNYIAITTYYINTVRYSGIKASEAYTDERGGAQGNYYGATWSGKIGLPYASDYGYAAVKGAWSTNLSSYNSYSNIKTNNWFLRENDSSGFLWLISPSNSSNQRALYWTTPGGVYQYEVGYSGRVGSVRPVLSLTSDTPIVGGTGAYNCPYAILESDVVSCS